MNELFESENPSILSAKELIDWAATLFFLANWSPHQSFLVPLRKLGRTGQATASTRRGELWATPGS
jgi:hypothetical protein